MTTQTINGHGHGQAPQQGIAPQVRAHASPGDHPHQASQAPKPAPEPTRARAISRLDLDRHMHTVREGLRAHSGGVRQSLTDGWAMTYRLPTPAEAAKKLLPVGSPWYWWPIDLLANLVTLALIMLAYLIVNALGTQPRRRAGLLLATAVTAAALLIAAIPAGAW